MEIICTYIFILNFKFIMQNNDYFNFCLSIKAKAKKNILSMHDVNDTKIYIVL